jgi:hypothetical protein
MARGYHFPEIVAITLQKYNSIDNKIYTLIKNRGCYTPHNNSISILVKSSDLYSIVKETYPLEIEKLEMLPNKNLYKGATTIYFINKFMGEMKNLRWFKITLCKNLSYSRISSNFHENEEKTLNFDFKVIRGSFKTFEFFDEASMPLVNDILKKVGCITDKHYSVVKLKSLEDRIANLRDASEGMTDEENRICSTMILHFSEWSEDNPQALIITDFLDI